MNDNKTRLIAYLHRSAVARAEDPEGFAERERRGRAIQRVVGLPKERRTAKILRLKRG